MWHGMQIICVEVRFFQAWSSRQNHLKYNTEDIASSSSPSFCVIFSLQHTLHFPLWENFPLIPLWDSFWLLVSQQELAGWFRHFECASPNNPTVTICCGFLCRIPVPKSFPEAGQNSKSNCRARMKGSKREEPVKIFAKYFVVMLLSNEKYSCKMLECIFWRNKAITTTKTQQGWILPTMLFSGMVPDLLRFW